MRIERIAEWELTAGDEAAIVRLLDRAFGDFDGRSFYKQRHHLRLVIRDGTEMIGHMALLYRAVRLGGELIDIVGLAEVATDPERRDEGIATRLLEASIAAAREARADFFVLFGVAGLYAGNGLRSVANTLRFSEMTGARTGETRETPNEGLMILPLGEREWDEDAELDLLGAVF